MIEAEEEAVAALMQLSETHSLPSQTTLGETDTISSPSLSLSLTMNEDEEEAVAALLELSDRRRLPPETTPAETDTTEPRLRMAWKQKRSRQITRAGLKYAEKEKYEKRKSSKGKSKVTSTVSPLSWSFGVGLPCDGYEASTSKSSKGKSKKMVEAEKMEQEMDVITPSKGFLLPDLNLPAEEDD